MISNYIWEDFFFKFDLLDTSLDMSGTLPYLIPSLISPYAFISLISNMIHSTFTLHMILHLSIYAYILTFTCVRMNGCASECSRAIQVFFYLLSPLMMID